MSIVLDNSTIGYVLLGIAVLGIGILGRKGLSLFCGYMLYNIFHRPRTMGVIFLIATGITGIFIVAYPDSLQRVLTIMGIITGIATFFCGVVDGDGDLFEFQYYKNHVRKNKNG